MNNATSNRTAPSSTPNPGADASGPHASPLGTGARLLVVGATGSLGRSLVPQALARGYAVTAFARNPQRLDINHRSLTLHAGDVRDPESIRSAVAGQDAVVIALGAPLTDRSGIRTEGTRRVVEAMEAVGVRRLVCLSILGLGESYSNLPWSYKAFVKPLLLRFPYLDHGGQEDLVRESDLDWTLVRPPTFTDGPATGQYRHGFASEVSDLTLKISRSDLASFMLDQVGSDIYSRACPAISY